MNPQPRLLTKIGFRRIAVAGPAKCRLNLCFTEAEWQELAERARAARMDVREYARKKLLTP